MAELETASIALTDLATAKAVQALCDKEHGYPKQCFHPDGSTPESGIPRTILHAQDPEPVGKDWAHPLPRAPLSLTLAAKVVTKTPTEIEALKVAAVELEPIKLEAIK